MRDVFGGAFEDGAVDVFGALEFGPLLVVALGVAAEGGDDEDEGEDEDKDDDGLGFLGLPAPGFFGV